MYSIKHNSILRDGEVIAEIKSNGMVEFNSPELEKYRLPVWNLLEGAGRITKIADGQDLAIWFETEEAAGTENTEEKQPKTVKNSKNQIPEDKDDDSRLVINTVRELREVVEKMTGEAAPFLSQSLGDKTPELWDYFRRHIDMFTTIQAAYVVNVKLDRLYK